MYKKKFNSLIILIPAFNELKNFQKRLLQLKKKYNILVVDDEFDICEMVSEKIIGMEMVELNPTLDIENKTGHLAVWLILSAMGKQII